MRNRGKRGNYSNGLGRNDWHQRAAEFKDLAAHAHRVAATHHGKEDHRTGQELSRQAMEYSAKAYQYSQEAHRLSGISFTERGTKRPNPSSGPIKGKAVVAVPLHFFARVASASTVRIHGVNTQHANGPITSASGREESRNLASPGVTACLETSSGGQTLQATPNRACSRFQRSCAFGWFGKEARRGTSRSGGGFGSGQRPPACPATS